MHCCTCPPPVSDAPHQPQGSLDAGYAKLKEFYRMGRRMQGSPQLNATGRLLRGLVQHQKW